MNFLLFGAGALGQALGCMLSCDGHQVDLILRKRFIDTIQNKGLRVSGIFGNFAAAPSQLGLFENVGDTIAAYDYVLITTKTYDTETAADAVASLGKRMQYLVSMQNGCGNIEILRSRFGDNKVLGARVITGFEIKAPGKVDITVSADDIHVGDCIGGSIGDGARHLSTAISSAGHPAIAVDDIHQSLYAKLLYNCTLNPLGAILGVHYGLLSEHTDTVAMMNKVMDETFEVITALGGKTPWPDSNSYRKFFYHTLLPATYNHRPSMLQDLENKKPTEVNALVGYVSMKGRELGVATPTCDLLAAMVRFKERQHTT